MAKTLDFKLNLDTKKAESEVDGFNKSLEETKKLSEFDLVMKNADAVKSVKELNESMEQLQNQALKFGEGSEEFVKAATKAGELKKRMDDVNKSIDTVASGGQLGQMTNSFEGLRVAAMSFDVEGVARNFALMKTQIAGAATSALGLGQGLNVAAIAARGLAIALAATGITLLIASVAVLVSEFENLSSAGGSLGAIFTGIGEIIDTLKTNLLSLLDSWGLIDLAAKEAADSQTAYLTQLSDDLDANGDKYDEYTKAKKQAEIDYYKKVDELRQRDDIDEKRKQELTVQYNEKRLRTIANADKDAIDKRKEDREKDIEDYSAYQEKLAEESQKRSDEIEATLDEEVQARLTAFNRGAARKEALVTEQFKNGEIDELTYTLFLYEQSQDRINAQVDAQKEMYDLTFRRYIDGIATETDYYNESIKLDELRTLKYKNDIDIRKGYQSEFLKEVQDIVDTRLSDMDQDYLLKRANLYASYRDGELSSESEFNKKLAKLDMDRAERELDIAKGVEDSLYEQGQKAVESGSITADELAKQKETYYKKVIQLSEDLIKAQIKFDGILVESQAKTMNMTLEEINQMRTDTDIVLGEIGNAVNLFSDIMSRAHQNRMLEINEEQQAKLNALQTQLNAGIITEQQFADASTAINEKYNRKKYEQQKKAFNQEKAINVVNATMAGIQSVQSAMASGMAYPFIGPATGAVFAGIAAAFSAAQIGMIASEKFPSYQSSGGGGNVSSSIPSQPSIPSQSGGQSQVPASYFSNSGAVIGSDAMLTPSGIYDPSGNGNSQVWVLESDITGAQNPVLL